jgi:hypothetical protein
MKKVLILLVAVLSLNSCGNKQTNSGSENEKITKNASSEADGPIFNIEELLSLNTKSPSQFESYVINRGYKLNYSDSAGDTIVLQYAYLNDVKINGATYILRHIFPKLGHDGLKHTVWSFTNIKEDNFMYKLYVNLKNEVEKIGFKNFSVSTLKDNQTNFAFNKGEKFVDFNNSRVSNSEKPIYTVSVYEAVKLKNKNDFY